MRKILHRYSRIDSYLLENGFEKCEGEPTLYIKENDGKILIVVLYVDDVIFTGNDDYLIENFKAVMKEEFEMTDMGLMTDSIFTICIAAFIFSQQKQFLSRCCTFHLHCSSTLLRILFLQREIITLALCAPL